MACLPLDEQESNGPGLDCQGALLNWIKNNLEKYFFFLLSIVSQLSLCARVYYRGCLDSCVLKLNGVNIIL